MFNLFFEVWDFFSSKFGKGHQISLGKKPNFDPLDHKKTLTKKKKKKKKTTTTGAWVFIFHAVWRGLLQACIHVLSPGHKVMQRNYLGEYHGIRHWMYIEGLL